MVQLHCGGHHEISGMILHIALASGVVSGLFARRVVPREHSRNKNVREINEARGLGEGVGMLLILRKKHWISGGDLFCAQRNQRIDFKRSADRQKAGHDGDYRHHDADER
jgi:hypothetical protein